MQIDPFFQVPQRSYPTSHGNIQLPVLFKEADAIITLFSCQRDRVCDQLAGTGLTPALVFGNQALVSITLYNFEISSIGPYRTAMLAIPVVRSRSRSGRSPWRELFLPADKRHMGFYLLGSCANTPVATASAKEIWGYNKQLTQIDFSLRESRLHCRVSDGVSTLLQLRGTGLRLASIKTLEFNMFSFRHNALLRTLLNTRGRFDAQLPLRYRLEVGDREHPLTQSLNALNLHGKSPLMVLASTDYQGRMNEGVIVEDAPLAKGKAAYANHITV